MSRRGSAVVRVVALAPLLAAGVVSCATGSTDDFGILDANAPPIDAPGESGFSLGVSTWLSCS